MLYRGTGARGLAIGRTGDAREAIRRQQRRTVGGQKHCRLGRALVSRADRRRSLEGQFFFTTVAGLALSVAGFGALVAAFRRGAAWSRTEVSRLRNIVRLGFVCMFLGLLPVPLYYAVGGDQLLTIRLASLVIAFAETWEVMLILRHRRHWENQSWVGPLVGVVSLEVAFNLLNAILGALPLLMVGLLLWLAHPVNLFIRVLRDFQPPVTGD